MSPTGFQVVSISYAGTAAGGHLPSGFRSRVEPLQSIKRELTDRSSFFLFFVSLSVPIICMIQ